MWNEKYRMYYTEFGIQNNLLFIIYYLFIFAAYFKNYIYNIYI